MSGTAGAERSIVAYRALLRIASAVAVALAFAAVPTPAMARPDFTGNSLGSLKLGMPAQQAAGLGWIEPGPSPCNSGWQTGRYRGGVFVGVWNEQIMLISTKSKRFRTSRGIRPGDSLSKLRKKYAVTRQGTNIHTGEPVFGARGTRLFFFVSKGKIALIELANGYRPNGSEFEC